MAFSNLHSGASRAPDIRATPLLVKSLHAWLFRFPPASRAAP